MVCIPENVHLYVTSVINFDFWLNQLSRWFEFQQIPIVYYYGKKPKRTSTSHKCHNALITRCAGQGFW